MSKRTYLRQARRGVVNLCALAALLGGASCSSVPLTQNGSLATYDNLGPRQGRLSKSRSFVDGPSVAAMTTVSLVPTTVSEAASSRLSHPGESRLVANAIDRTMCVALSDKYRIVPPGQTADLTVHATVTDIVPTGKVAAGLSTAVTLGSSVVLPVGVPRLPLGLGGMAAEVEAVDLVGQQRAAMVWSKGANSITNMPRVSEIGDAYNFAGPFSAQFANLLVKGRAAGSGLDIQLPSRQRIRSSLGGKPKEEACAAFGRAPGVGGLIAGTFGVPPSWTDHGADSEIADATSHPTEAAQPSLRP